MNANTFASAEDPKMYKRLQDADGINGSFSYVGNACVVALCVLPEATLLALYYIPVALYHPLLIYYAVMILVPTIFIIMSGSLGAYAKILQPEAAFISKATFARACVAFLLGFALQNVANMIITHHSDWRIWHTIVWKDPANVLYATLNPMMETFFWRIFLHREMAVRFFPGKADPDDELPMLNTPKPTIPRLSSLGMLFNGLAFGLYHYVPLVMFDLPVYSAAGVTYWMMIAFIVYLCLFGVGTVYVREQRQGGPLAALMLHAGVDAENILAYALIMDTTMMSGRSVAAYKYAWAAFF